MEAIAEELRKKLCTLYGLPDHPKHVSEDAVECMWPHHDFGFIVFSDGTISITDTRVPWEFIQFETIDEFLGNVRKRKFSWAKVEGEP